MEVWIIVAVAVIAGWLLVAVVAVIRDAARGQARDSEGLEPGPATEPPGNHRFRWPKRGCRRRPRQ